MVHNPIYDGPVYDSIQEDIRTLTPIANSLAKAESDVSSELPCPGTNTTVTVGSQTSDLQEDKPINTTRYITTPNRSLQTPTLSNDSIDSKNDAEPTNQSHPLHDSPVALELSTLNNFCEQKEQQSTHFCREKTSDHNHLDMDSVEKECSNSSLTNVSMACVNPPVLSDLDGTTIQDGTYMVMNPIGCSMDGYGKPVINSEESR